ncbi:MAG: Do family serine endopeptidase, partial [Calditrichaeota bacterium]
MYKRSKRFLVILISVLTGTMIGLVLASKLDWTGRGLADEEPTPPAFTTPQTHPLVGSDLEATSRAFVEIAKRVTPTVVSITSEKVVRVRDPFADFFGHDDFFRRFFRVPDGGEQEYRQHGLGSGVIVSPDGYILTNYHVVKDADEISVVMNGEQIKARIVGTDPASDIAVVKIDRRNLPAIVLGDSDKLEVGEWVLAIGSPFDLRLEHTVTSGIISAKGRTLNLSRELTYQDFIQTDAAINPGNSGGALVNIRGELIGINTAIYAGNTGGNVGIGFAIPINLAKSVMDDLIAHGKVVRGYLGVVISTPDEQVSKALKLKDRHGALVNEVVKGTPADRAGLKKYDMIVEVDGKKIRDSQMLTNLIARYSPGARVRLKVIRDGRVKEITVELEERPGETESQPVFARNDVLGRLGLELADLTRRLADRYAIDETEGVVITRVHTRSVAQEKGLRPGDLITE